MLRYAFVCAAIALVFVTLTGCSALLDTDSLESGRQDGAPPDQKIDGLAPDLLAPDAADIGPYSGSLLHKRSPRGPRTYALAAPGSEPTELVLRWRDLPGRPANVDLAVGVPQAAPDLLQVFARDNQPYLRSGLKVVPLSASRDYVLRISRDRETAALHVSVARLDDRRPLVETTVPAASVSEPKQLAVTLATSDLGRPRVQLIRRSKIFLARSGMPATELLASDNLRTQGGSPSVRN